MTSISSRKEAVLKLMAKLAPAGTTGWRPAKSLIKLREEVNAAWPGRSKKSDGIIGDEAHQTRDSDHNPWVRDGNTGVVTAIDITHDPDAGVDASKLVAALLASRDVRIKYIIWNKQIVNSSVSPWVARPYKGKNPHTKHFHLSVSSNKALYDDEKPWAIGKP